MAASQGELLIARDTLIFLLQNMGFFISTQKSILDLTSTLEFLGVLVDSQNDTKSATREKGKDKNPMQRDSREEIG